MFWRPIRSANTSAATLVALGCALCFLSVRGVAQNACRPEDEIFGGYAWLAPNGWGDLNYKINNIPNAFDASNTYYLPKTPNLGLLVDGSGHFRGGTTPPNLDNGANNATAVGYTLGGLQYKYHTNSLSPFLRGFIGAASISPDCCGGTQWNLAAGGGGGLDLTLNPRFSIRLVQADYIYSNYNHRFETDHPTQWNSVRLAAGVVFSIGSYCSLPLSCTATATPMPAEVLAGEPIRLTTAGTNFNSKHSLNYAWTTNGGKLSSAATQAAEIDTTGLAPGSYAVSATIADPKIKKLNSTTCSTTFVVKPPPPAPRPPIVSCAANPAMVAVGESSTITMTASSPDQRPLTYSWSADGGQLSGTGTTATLATYPADGGKTITITATATDDRSLSASSHCSVDVKPPVTEPCVKPDDWGECTFDKDPRRPGRVDNDCKDVLDKLAIRLQDTPNGPLGYRRIRD